MRYIVKSKVWNFPETSIRDEKGTEVYETQNSALRFSDKLRLVDKKTRANLYTIEEKAVSAGKTMYVKKGNEVVLTLRKKLLSSNEAIFAYHGKVSFDLFHLASAKPKAYKIEGLDMWFESTVVDMKTNTVAMSIRETECNLGGLVGDDEYVIETRDDRDPTLLLALVLTLDLMKEEPADYADHYGYGKHTPR